MKRFSAKDTQLQKGTRTEAEHKSTYDKLKVFVQDNGEMPSREEFYRMIAEDHIAEHEDYYDKLMKAGL